MCHVENVEWPGMTKFDTCHMAIVAKSTYAKFEVVFENWKEN